MKSINAFYVTKDNKVCSPLFLRSECPYFEEILAKYLVSQKDTNAIVFTANRSEEEFKNNYSNALDQ